MKRRIAATAMLLTSTQATAQPYMDATLLAVSLGSILGSETACNLEFNQSSVQAYISKNADPSDLTLPNGLNLMTQGTEHEIQQMSETQRTAHCQLVAQSASEIGILRK